MKVYKHLLVEQSLWLDLKMQAAHKGIGELVSQICTTYVNRRKRKVK